MARQDVSICGDPNALLALAPCTQCLSISELKRVLVAALGWFENYDMPDDLDALIENSKCWACTSSKQKLEAAVIVLGQFIFEEGPQETQVTEMLACLRCVDDEHIDAALIFLICSFFEVLFQV